MYAVCSLTLPGDHAKPAGCWPCGPAPWPGCCGGTPGCCGPPQFAPAPGAWAGAAGAAGRAGPCVCQVSQVYQPATPIAAAPPAPLRKKANLSVPDTSAPKLAKKAT